MNYRIATSTDASRLSGIWPIRTEVENLMIAEKLQAFADARYVRMDSTSKIDLFEAPNHTKVYAKNIKAMSIVVHPDDKTRALKELKNLGTMGEAYHNSNIATYPKRKHTGEKPIAYGYAVNFETASALREFLIAFGR